MMRAAVFLRSFLLLTLISSTLTAADLTAADLTVSLLPAHGIEPVSKAVFEIIATDSEGQEIHQTKHGFGEVRLSLPDSGSPDSGSIWTLRVVAAGYWTEPATIGSEIGEKKLILWPTTRLTGALLLEGEEDSSEPLKIRFDPARPEEPRPPPAGREICRLATEHQQRRFICDIPAGLYDLRFRMQGYVSHYLWENHSEAGAVHDVGTIFLRPGTSVAGWVETAEPV